MPVYEYRCNECGRTFDHSEPMAEHGKTVPSCPDCRSRDVHSVPRVAFVKTSRKS